MTKIDSYYSQKIKVLNLLLIVLVVYIHSYYLEAENGHPIALSIQRICGGNGLSCIANPLFFTISGFLFFNGISHVKDCMSKIRKRMRTLLIPYILWNCIFLLWYIALQNIPSIGGFINSDMVSKIFGGSIIQELYELLITPAAFQLWFLRDLIIMVICSPLLYLMCKYMKWWTPILWALLLPWARVSGTPYFTLGGCIALYCSLEKISNCLRGEQLAAFTLIYLGNAVAQIFDSPHHPYISFVVCLCGMAFIWKSYDYITCIHPEKIEFLCPFLGYSFFIYCSHEPAFNIIKKLGLKILGIHEWSLILLYIINPLIMCAAAIGVAKILQKFLPKMYGILTGGR